jgi:microcystin-dependent protein
MPLKSGKTTASVQTILTGSVIPSGTIAPFGGGTVPAGWLLCDGATVSRATYSALFEVVGTLHGQGDGSTTFHLPDYRGRFLRGADNMGTGAAGRDPDAGSRTAANTGGATGATVGSVQDDEFESHFHGMNVNNADTGTGANVNRDATANDAIINTNSTGGNETRPKNANVNYIIKV